MKSSKAEKLRRRKELQRDLSVVYQGEVLVEMIQVFKDLARAERTLGMIRSTWKKGGLE